MDGLLRCGAILDRGMIYWDIRLSEHQATLETRIADVMPTVEQATLLAVLLRAMAGRALDGGSAPEQPSQEVLRGHLWRAARDGLTGRCADPRSGDLVPTWQLVEDLTGDLGPHLRSTGDEEFVAATLARLCGTGGGAQRQRAVFARRERLTDVVDGLAWPQR